MYESWVRTIKEALDVVGLALANEGHVWTEYEREKYDDAVRLLEEISPTSQEERAAGGMIEE